MSLSIALVLVKTDRVPDLHAALKGGSSMVAAISQRHKKYINGAQATLVARAINTVRGESSGDAQRDPRR